MEGFDQFLNAMFTEQRLPFWSAVLVFTAIGHFMTKHFFIRERADAKGRCQWFWWWGRESQVLHPLVLGMLWGFIWPDPEGRHWNRVASCMYFAAAGALSLIFWVLIQGYAKKKGVVLTLPGDSDKPPCE